MEVKRFYTTNWIVGQIKRHLTEWDNFCPTVNTAEFFVQVTKKHKKPNIKKTNHPI